MKVLIERFKNIEKIEVDVSSLTLLVGGNNAGKSSVLQAIQFGISAAQTADVQGGLWKGSRLSTSISQADLLYSPLKEVVNLARNGMLKEAENEAICITYNDGDECKILIKKGRNKNIVITMFGEILGKKLQSIINPLSSLVTGLAGIPAEERYETSFYVKKAYARGDSNSVFRNILNLLKKDSTHWDDFTNKLQSIFGNMIIELNFDPDKNDTILCNVNNNGLILPIDSCGTGVLQAIQIFAYSCLFQPKILLLDEPDSHLHPNNQKLLADELIKLANKGSLIIVSTHSKTMIESLIDHSNMLWVAKGKIVNPIENYTLKALIDIGALNEGDRISNSKYIILTEDSDTSLLCILLESNSIDLNDCEILSYNGCTRNDTALIFIEYLKKSNSKAKYIIHRDRDFMTDDQLSKYKEQFVGSGVDTFVSTGNDLESYFLTREHLKNVLEISDSDYESIINDTILSKKDVLQTKYVNTRIENNNKERPRPCFNAGDISVEFTHAIESKDFKFMHGKILLAGVRDVLRIKGISDRILSGSDALIIKELKDLFEEHTA
jgi:AAA15 family ATPase/GTPase